MNNCLRNHEKFIKEALADPKTDCKWLLNYHETWIGFMQHERLIHLMVTIAFGVVLMIAFGVSMISDSFYLLILDGILIILLGFYIAHYYQLENGVQRWYILYDDIIKIVKAEGENHD